MMIKGNQMLVGAACLLLSSFGVSAQDDGGICYMQYSMADNNLYSFLVEDINELQSSELIRDPSLTFWNYVDGSKIYGIVSLFKGIDGVKFPDGTDAPEMHDGARYLTWDHDQQALVQMETFGEVNSDTTEAVADFLAVAIADCVAKGKSQYMLIMSSHGDGFGFGGDEEFQERRRLVQPNANIVSAIRQTLDSIEGAPEKLDLLGFDACLQASLESLKDYQDVTKYYLASEAIEPGTGYAYNKLTPQTTVLDVASQIIDTYVSTPDSKQFIFFGKGVHKGPKTLAIFNMDKIDPFYEAWENLSTEMTRIITAHNDTQFYSVLTRSRASTASFSGSYEVPSGEPNDAFATMDIGHFLEVFSSECNPGDDAHLKTLLEDTKTPYNDMIVKFDKGPSTKLPATGLATLWVPRKMYLRDTAFYDFVLFDTSEHFYNHEAPNYTNFLLEYLQYDETKNVPSEGTPICGCPEVLPRDGQLMWNQLVQQSPDKETISVQAELADTVDSLLVEFGVDATHLLDGEEEETSSGPSTRHHRQLHSKFTTWQEKIKNRKVHASSQMHSKRRHLAHSPLSHVDFKAPKEHSRRAQEGEQLQEGNLEDYLLIFGGMVYPQFGCGRFDASWDKNFYVLMNQESGEMEDFMYVYRGDNGESRVPVFYFPNSTTDAFKSEIQTKLENFDLSIEDAESMGGQWSHLVFDSATLEELPEGADSLPLDFVPLYTPSSTGAPAETDTSLGGFILPVLYIEGQLSSVPFEYIVGGFFNQIIEWKANSTLGIAPIKTEEVAFELESNHTVIDLVAYDYVSEDVEPQVQFNYYLLTHGEGGEILQIENPEDDSAAVGKLFEHSLLVGVVFASWFFVGAGW